MGDKFFNAQPPFYSPLCLSTELVAVGSTLAIGALASPQAVAIRNPNRTAMLIDAFKFVVDGSTTIPISNGTVPPLATAQLQVQIALGNIPLTNNFVPVLSLCPTYHAATGAMYVETNPVMTWHLPRPIYVPPDVALSAQFTQAKLSDTIDGSGFAGPLRFSVLGRSLPSNFRVPEAIFVPWATAARTVNSTATTFITNDSDLANPFPQPLRVTRFIGHAPWITTSAGAVTAVFSSQATPLTTRMTLSSNSILVQSETPFYSLFTPSRRNMDVDGILQASEFVRAVVDAPDGFSTGAGNLGMADLSIGMIGYRVLKTPQGSW